MAQEVYVMHGVCDQCHEYITETDQCLCTHAIHAAREIDCPWCELDAHEQAEIREELGLGMEWEVLWLGHNYARHRAGCGPVYGLRSVERTFAYCIACQTEMTLDPTA
jgi:hypothetical protein